MRQVDLIKEEEKTLKFWEENKIFEKTLEATKNGKPFVFFEGPPTANGRPGIHHVLARSFKDIICRFQTMNGRFVSRRAGWDTHGLPVEIEVEKKLGLKNKKEVESFGIAKFNKECKESVWKYKDEWERLTRRMGFWLDLKNAYVTYEPKYIESVWAIIKKIWDKNLLVKDYKIVPFCVRCGTPISSHEVAQGYETVTDKSVIIKFKVKEKTDTYLLAWTTTPWTLPGNVALAVGEKIEYAQVDSEGSKFILAKDLVAKIFEGKEYKISKTLSALEVAKLSYESLFAVKGLQSTKSYKVYIADFVNTEEGTGIVHTAVMYGADDFELGNKVGLPKFHTVDMEGIFIKSVPIVGGLGIIKDKVKDPVTEKTILLYLKKQNLLFGEANYSHEYPFCWRCKSPLLYYAKESWFIKMSSLKNDLIKNNSKINWIPEHLKEGRFGEWLREIKDWALSRERYWGTPLPIWECKKCESRKIIGSLEELNENRLDSPATLVLVRHGTAESNENGFCSSYPEKTLNPLAEEGRKQVEATAQKIKKEFKKIDAIYSSDLLRARETAQILADELKVKNVIFEERLREIDFGDFNGKPIKEYSGNFKTFKERFLNPAPNGESLQDVSRRTGSFIKEIGKKYVGKTVLIASHQDTLFTIQMQGGIYGEDEMDLAYNHAMDKKADAIHKGEFKVLTINNWPVNENGSLDLHRPYIDEVFLKCSSCSTKMERVKDLIDVWFDSGAMPFAQIHYPFENKEVFKNQFPADYISEAIDQTRGWFYTLLAISTATGEGAPYKNVVSLNHVLDEKGEKMSKSRGNIVDPWMVGEKVGFDILRWYFYTANAPGDNKLFGIKDVESKKRRFMDTLVNSFLFLETYFVKPPKSLLAKKDILDEWILIRLENLRARVTLSLEKYDITSAARIIEEFVDDLSNWYIRRSRRKFQKQNIDSEKLAAQETLAEVLMSISVLLAPFTPFLAEWLYQEIRGLTRTERGSTQKIQRSSVFIESVHLEKWPSGLAKAGKKQDIEKIMDKAREIVALGLAERARAGIRVRQLLNTLYVSNADYSVIGDVLNIVAEELNVKNIVVDRKLIKGSVTLDTEITPELKEAGFIRELIRNVNEMRKDSNLTPEDKVVLYYNIYISGSPSEDSNNSFKELLARHEDLLKSETRSKEINIGIENVKNLLAHKTWNYEGYEIELGIKNV
jgi:isoleucyl-tRNA synthetase